ncbi:MAG: RnfH family protein [Gammaproteobacteria bacterium]|nr:MAG: RnfH family protein [Gammaproteobacteria bacterium]
MAEVDAEPLLTVEVVYATPERQTLIKLRLPSPVSAREAVLQSGLLARHPEIDLDQVPLGIFGEAVAPGQLLADGDRVELYRPLAIDPREARRQLARHRRTMRDTRE